MASEGAGYLNRGETRKKGQCNAGGKPIRLRITDHIAELDSIVKKQPFNFRHGMKGRGLGGDVS